MNLSLSRSFPIAKAALAAAVIACVVALTCSLAGCASGGTGSSSADADNTSASTDGKTLRVAMELAYPPFETKDDAGNPEGLAVDFIRDFGAAYGYDVQIENTAWDGLIPSLQSDKADLVISSMTITDERKQSVDFSDAYAMAQLAILANADSGVASIDDLNQPGKKVAVKTGSTGDVYATKNLTNAEIVRLADESACVTEVVQDKADGFLYDQLTIYRKPRYHRGRVHPLPGRRGVGHRCEEGRHGAARPAERLHRAVENRRRVRSPHREVPRGRKEGLRPVRLQVVLRFRVI